MIAGTAWGVLAGSLVAVHADWPTYRHDAARSGYTAEALPSQLSLQWTLHLPHSPQPAWPRSPRLNFDPVCHPVIAAGLVCFGSSADGQLHARDAGTGAARWTFATDAPVRLAPVFGNGRFYAASDDGHLYCLDATTGQLLWKHRGAPNEELILGNGRMISRWPARGGPVVAEGVVYYAAGIWPSDGIYLYALAADTGRVLWVNDTAGQLYLGQPHGGAFAHSGISPQGHLAISAERLFVPNGRAVPAAFRRADGAFEYFHLQPNGQRGNPAVTVWDRFFLNDDLAFDQATGSAAGNVGRGTVVAMPDGLLHVSPKEIVQYRQANPSAINRAGGKPILPGLTEALRLRRPVPTPVAEVIVARDDAIIGFNGRIARLHLPTSNEVWRTTVDGAAHGLAVAEGRLYVSTDEGGLYCFGDHAGPPQTIRVQTKEHPYGPNTAGQRVAAEILQRTGITNGYCLDLGCGDGALAFELARQSQLHVVAVDADAGQVIAARTRLSEAGWLGSRVTVLPRDPARSGLPNYFANLIVSGRSLTAGAAVVPAAEALRLLRPYGGVRCLGRPGALEIHRRGPLEGAGNWTHQYADAANTLCSTDALVRGPLGLLWFADVDQRMVQRHGRPPAPLFQDGILYSIGVDSLVAVDAYNGRKLWEYPLPGILEAYDGDHLMGVSGSGSNFCLSEDSVYVRREDHCLRLDARTGRVRGRFNAPPTAGGQPSIWGFIAYEDGLLYGSLANPEHVVTYRYLKGGNLTNQLTEARGFFALDATTGQLKWRYDARHSLRHNALAVGGGTVLLIDRPLSQYDRVRGAEPAGDQGGELLALDAATGTERWRNTNDIYGTVLILSVPHHKVLMSYQPTRFRLASELGGRMACFNLSAGDRVWDRHLKYQSRPLLNDRTIYAEGGAWDLLTGEARPFPFQRSYGCGILAGSQNLLVFRSATLGYYDLELNRETEEFGGIRPGCWVNILPVGGLVFAPESAAGCVCSYPNQSWLALQPDGVRPPVIEPAGGTFRDPVRVRLRSDQPAAAQIHFTLDGTLPTSSSPRFGEPLTLQQTTVLQARSFGPNHRASRVVNARFTIDPDVLFLQSAHWRSWDAPGAKPASAWIIRPEGIEQTANTLVAAGQAMGKEPAAERPGTLYIYGPGAQFTNGDLSFRIQSTDNDTVGVAFRFRDAAHHYLWFADSERGFRALAAKDGERFAVLASNRQGYVRGQWHAVRLRLDGPRITAFVDGRKDLEVEDHRYSAGTVALYSWGNSGVKFQDLKFVNR